MLFEYHTTLQKVQTNGMVANPKKFQLMLPAFKGKRAFRQNIEGTKIPMKTRVEILGVEIDSKLKLIARGDSKYLHNTLDARIVV